MAENAVTNEQIMEQLQATHAGLQATTGLLATLTARMDTMEASVAAMEEVKDEEASADTAAATAAATDVAATHKEPDGDEEEDDEEEEEVSAAATTVVKPATVVDASTAVLQTRLDEALKSNRMLTVSVRKLQKQISAMQAKMDKQGTQIAAAAATTQRRSVRLDNFTASLLQRNGLDPVEIEASGQKLTRGQVDSVIKASGLNLAPVESAALKNRLVAAGLME